jgi:hypothetical protein
MADGRWPMGRSVDDWVGGWMNGWIRNEAHDRSKMFTTALYLARAWLVLGSSIVPCKLPPAVAPHGSEPASPKDDPLHHDSHA